MELPYHQIPDYPQSYTSGAMLSRMIDGLGYRYYWATEGLKASNLKYRTSEDGRNCFETLEHIFGLSVTILNGIRSKPNIRPYDIPVYSFDELRKLTLENLQKASSLALSKTETDLETSEIIFQRGEAKSEFPFWHMLNGPLADAIYHTGQIVILRRASGNPMNPKVNVFTGKTRE